MTLSHAAHRCNGDVPWRNSCRNSALKVTLVAGEENDSGGGGVAHKCSRAQENLRTEVHEVRGRGKVIVGIKLLSKILATESTHRLILTDVK